MSVSSNNSPSPRSRISAKGWLEAHDLHNKLDELKRIWVQAEKTLKAKINPPRHVWVAYRKEVTDPNGFERYDCLGVIRYRGEWRLCIAHYEEPHEEGPSDWKPMTDCSFEDRLDAAPHIFKLAKEIEKSEAELGPRIDDAVQLLKDALTQL
jgi:hypothetical protein